MAASSFADGRARRGKRRLHRAVAARVREPGAEIASDWITAEARLGLTHSHPKAWCTASAVYNSTYNDYDVYVHSNQPYTEATATASNGESRSYETNGSGYADIYLYADPGDSIQVSVGAASCSATA
jgi:hypothetical protein